MEVVIRPNDSFWYYSELFDIPLVLIAQSNPNLDASQLAVGQIVQIPGYMADMHQIAANDTLWRVAMNQNIPVDMLQLSNPDINPEDLQIDQQIVVPQQIRDLIITDFDDYTFDKMADDMNRLITAYPFIIYESIGSSVMGKDIAELRIGTGSRRVHINGSFHANEWITTPVIMRFINEYARSLTNGLPIRGLNLFPFFFETTLSVVPMVNPDGVNLVLNGASAAENYQDDVLKINNQNPDFSNWKANIRGVDLNNQYPAQWEIEAARKPVTPQPRDYPGPHPLSEPEAEAMADLALERDFVRVNALHTQGEVIYWGFEGLEPPAAQEVVNEYNRVSGYEPIRYVDSYAGFKDWFIQEFRRGGYTIELGTGINPLPFEQFEEIYQETLGIMLANLYLQL
ncbi:M14 family metallopeptidase [Lentibacillus amyloliquefaciens]|uniref:Peptidase M14 n=1 Tax=Lentibacillus amyloliquefaciens TaxID=1472767 RepID=A0A0U4FJG8_9BACI|nr:M14 family metallopeptidase [Lentibacillus amyloliquefaciens]ALX47908.1 peptidase M14 [Lentibacillus amyloliquefaciens]